jgi:lambda family phage portal protein
MGMLERDYGLKVEPIANERQKRVSVSRRSITATAMNRLTPGDWRQLNPLEQLLTSNYIIRERARNLEKTNDFAERFLMEFEANVPGPMGFTFQSYVRELMQDKNKNWIWQDDELANNKIEEAFALFSKSENFSVTGQFTRAEAESMMARMWARDGEVFVRIIPMQDAKFGMKVQVLEAELVDERLNTVNSTNGNVIKMGVEIDKWRKPVAYYIRKQTTTNQLWGSIQSTGEHERIDARFVMHLFYQKYPNQTRGISLLVQSMVRMKRLSDYEEAVLINAEISAKKMGFFSDKNPEVQEDLTVGAGITETDDQGNEYDSGNQVMDVSAGSFEDIGAKEFTAFSPEFPTAQHEPFVKATSKSFSAGLGVGYSSITNDLSEASWSSDRSGKATITELWKSRQMRFVNRFSMPMFTQWLEFAIYAGSLNLPIAKFDKFNQPIFIGRRWGYIDPLKDIMADALAVEYGFTTRTQILAERGFDVKEVNAELAKEQEDVKTAGITLKFNEELAMNAATLESASSEVPVDGAAKKREIEEDQVLVRAAAYLLGKKAKSNGQLKIEN